MSELTRETQKLTQSAKVDMYEIDLNEYGEGILRFTPGPLEGDSIVFAGKTYQSFPVKASGFKWDGNGTPPRPTLSITGQEEVFTSLVRAYGDLVGVSVVRLRTFERFLDNGTSPDSQSMFAPEFYRIERKSKSNSKVIEFELSVEMDQQGLMIPGRQVLRDSCTHTYRYWTGTHFTYTNVSCPYTGGQSYTRAGTQADPEDDICGKGLSDCRLRFGQNAPLPFWGFPGVGRY